MYCVVLYGVTKLKVYESGSLQSCVVKGGMIVVVCAQKAEIGSLLLTSMGKFA